MEWSGTPAVTEVEAVIEPDRVADGIGWESVTLISIQYTSYQIWPVQLPIAPNPPAPEKITISPPLPKVSLSPSQ